MEKGQLIETYRILQKCKLNGLKQNTKFALLHDMSILRPISLAWKDELEEARERLKTDGLSRMNEAEVDKANRIFGAYNTEVNAYSEKALNTEMNTALEAISEDELNKLIDNNDLTGYDMECVNYPFAKDKWASRFTATCLLFRRVRSLTVAPHVYSQVPYEVLMSCTDNANIQLLI